MKILITGASGFIGSFLTEEALRRGYDTWAGVRRTSSREYLSHEELRFIELDFTRPLTLLEQLSAHKKQYGAWEVVIHCAGVTKCRHREEFMQGNYVSTQHLVKTLTQLDMLPKQFIYLSSLSVFGPIREDDYSPIREDDTPAPNTAYGESKLQTEQYLQSIPQFPYLIFRPTGVYGPREKDYFLMAKSIKGHVDFAPGFKRQDLTFVYVKDLVKAIYLAVDKQTTRRAYFVSDGNVYTSRTFSDLLQQEMKIKHVVHITCPLFLLKAVSWVAEKIALLQGKSSTLNGDKYNIMKQRNWQCDISPLVQELGYRPDYPLERGVKEIVAWYTEKKWL